MSEDETDISRVTRSKEEAKASYDRISKWYDILARSERKYGYKGLQKISVKEGEIVLEIGFGTGHCIQALAHSAGTSGKVYGIDLSQRMRDIAQARIKRVGLSERVNLQCGDAANLPFETNFFDVVFMSFTLELFDTPEIPTVLHECKRVLRSGGRICIVSLLCKRKKISVRLYEWFHRKFPKLVDCRPIFVKKELEDINFQILNAEEKYMWGLPVGVVLAKNV
jgi:demethylmenaquinone methyltransferase/2-methoxy-6-polyprenyl-1,4-benzoquinol methylase